MTSHVHADLIKAWADGAIIQYYLDTYNAGWEDCTPYGPAWDATTKYRIKPEEILLEGIPLKVGEVIYYAYSNNRPYRSVVREVVSFDSLFIWTKDFTTGEVLGNNYHSVFTRTPPAGVAKDTEDEALTEFPKEGIKLWLVDLWVDDGVRSIDSRAYHKHTMNSFLRRSLLFSTKEGALKRLEFITNGGKRP